MSAPDPGRGSLLRQRPGDARGSTRLLLAEDDAQLSALLARGLREHAYDVDAVGDGDAAVERAADNDYAIAVLDARMPKRDGFDVCRELRRRGNAVPVLMLTARDSVDDRVAGLDAGADDYLTKPFEFTEVLARLRALQRRSREVRPTHVVIGDLTIDTIRQSASRDGQRLRLTTKEYALLEYLATHAGRLVGRADISAHVWDDSYDPFSNAIETTINRLRRKVDDGRSPMIHTRRGAGYVLAVTEPASRAGGRTGPL